MDELNEAEKVILQRVQIVEFPDELKTVTSQANQEESKKLPKKKGSAFRQLNPLRVIMGQECYLRSEGNFGLLKGKQR